MEQQLLAEFLDTWSSPATSSSSSSSGSSSGSIKAINIARSLIINTSTSDSTISSIFQTLTTTIHSLLNNPNDIYLHHYIISVLYDLSQKRPQLRHLIYTTTLRNLPNNSTPRNLAHALSLLLSIAASSELEVIFVSLTCSCSIPGVTHWLLINANTLLLPPSFLLPLFLAFTMDPYPLIRKLALDALFAFTTTNSNIDPSIIQGCYSRALHLLSRDFHDCVRTSAVRVVSKWGQLLVASSQGQTQLSCSDSLFENLCSNVRDMCVDVRLEVFNALGKIKMASENILLQTLSKKVHIKTQTSSIAGALVHGMEDEYHEVRRSACSSLRPLSILSSEFACKALNLLVDMLNDDSIDVRLQVLQTMHHMAKHDRQVQEEHLYLLFGTLFDTSTSIRSEARRIIQLLKLHSSAMFKLCVNGLVENLETYPQDEADIISVLFNIGRDHGRYAVSIVEETSQDIDDFFEGKLGSDGAKIASFLVLAISAPLSDEINICRIPPRMFSYAVTLLGRISLGLAYIMDQHKLLSYLCACSRSTSVSALELIKGDLPLQKIVNDSGNQESWELSRKQASRLDFQLEGNEVVALAMLILAQINNIWLLMQIGCIDEVLSTLRSWKDELESINITSPQSFGVLLFALKYIRVLELFGKAWTNFMSPKKLLLFTGEVEINFGEVDYKLREMIYTFLGLDKEMAVHLLELMLVTYTLKLCSLESWCHPSTVKKLHSTYSIVELLLEKGSVEPSNFLVEFEKSLHEIGTSIDGFSNFVKFKKLLELFSLKQVVLSGGLKHIKAELDIVNGNYETPISFVSGLPVGIPLRITLYNVVLENRLWLKMTVNKDSCQFVYLDLKQFGDCDAIKTITFVAPFYRTPKASFFKLTVSIGMECISSDELLLRNCSGPKHDLVYLCNEKEVYFSMIVK